MRRLVSAVFILISLSFFLGCGSDNHSYENSKDLRIDLPSSNERNFGEKRDFYVMGSFSQPLSYPGDVQIELYRGTKAEGKPVRVIKSHVDSTSGTTPDSSIEKDYQYGQSWGLSIAPDLINSPGGLKDPNNKVLVTNEYYAGMMLGGVTKGFDTTYTDSEGNTLEDLTEGEYLVRVVGISGELEGQVASAQVTFGLTDSALGRFKPTENKDRLVDFAKERGLRVYLDSFPGYFSPDGSNTYEIMRRWIPNNSLEVVNTLQGTEVDNPANALNDIVLYNIKGTSATQAVEIGALVANNILSWPQTSFYVYDIGEPTLHYVNLSGESVVNHGELTHVQPGRNLQLLRVDIESINAVEDENLYIVDDPEPKIVDIDLSDGITLGDSEEFELFGAVLPIPSATVSTDIPGQYIVLNGIDKIHYQLFSSSGALVLEQTKPVLLNRVYDAAQPSWLSPSVYEFKHEFPISLDTGRYDLRLYALDTEGSVVPGTDETLSVTVRRPGE